MAEAKKEAGVDIDRLESDFQADPSSFVPLAQAYMERNLPIQAIQVCRKGLSHNASVQDGQLALAMAYYHNYDDNRAEVEFKKVLRSAPDNYVAHRSLGEIYLERKQEQKAVAALVQALELEPGDSHTRALLKSLDEKVPALKSGNGQVDSAWLPRQIHSTKIPPKPLWKTFGQILGVALAVVLFLVWYNGYVDKIVVIRADIDKAIKMVPRDNFDDLIAAEELLAGAKQVSEDSWAYPLSEGVEHAHIHLARIRSLLFEDHGLVDLKPKLEEHLKWFEAEELPVSERYGVQGILMLADGKAAEAEKMLTETITRAIEKKDIFLNEMVFGVRAAAYLAQGKMQEAREDYSRAAKFSSLSPHYQGLYANVYLREGNLGRAVKYFSDALRANPDHIYSNVRQAYTYLQLGRGMERARKILDKLLDEQKHPTAEFSKPLRSMLYETRAEYALVDAEEGPVKSKEWLDKALREYDLNAEAYNLKGRLAALDKNAADASSAFARALQIDPRLPRIYFDRAESMFELGQQQEAVDKLKEFEKSLPPTVAYYVKRGELFLRMDKLEDAQKEFEAAIKHDELDPKGRYWLARTWQNMGDKLPAEKENEEAKREFYNKAREEYENAVMLPGGETPDVYHQMGLIYLASENYENALDKMAKSVMMMQKAGESSAKVADVYHDISKIFKELGGEEGEKQEKVYLAKEEALRAGKSVEDVENEWAAKEKEEKKKTRKKKRRKRSR